MIDMAIGTLVSSSMPAGCGQDFLTYATTRLVGKLASSSASIGRQLWSPTKWIILANILASSMNNVVPDEISAFGLENEEDEWLTDDIEESSRESHPTVDHPWSVTQEARLIVGCKDISDEPGIPTTVFKQNQQILRDMEGAFREAPVLGPETKTNALKNLAQQQKTIGSKLLEIGRMGKGAKCV